MAGGGTSECVRVCTSANISPLKKFELSLLCHSSPLTTSGLRVYTTLDASKPALSPADSAENLEIQLMRHLLIILFLISPPFPASLAPPFIPLISLLASAFRRAERRWTRTVRRVRNVVGESTGR